MSHASELRELRRLAEAQNWTLEPTSNGRIRWIPPVRGASAEQAS